MSYKKQELFALREHLGSPSFLSKEVRVVHLLNFLSCITFSFGLRSMSCVSNVSNVSRFSNLLCSKLCSILHFEGIITTLIIGI